MIKIELNNNGLFIADKKIKFPISRMDLRQLLGEERHSVLKFGHKHTWDKYGIVGHSKNGEDVENLYINLQKEEFDFSPKNNFAGELLIDGQNILEYRKNNLDKLLKIYKEDEGGKFIRNGISCWFNVNDVIIKGIEILKDNGEFYQEPLKANRQTSVSIDEKYNYLLALWETWKSEITKIVPIENKYFNLKYGIIDSEATLYTDLDENIKMPDELIAFYKIYDVDYNPVTSAFHFSVNNWTYDLLPFKQIKEEWESIIDLNWNDPEEVPNDVAKYDPKVKANDYANPRWIPFAEGKNGDFLLYDTNPSETGNYGQIIELQNESWKRTVVVNSLSALLQNEIDLLKNGNTESFDFILGKK